MTSLISFIFDHYLGVLSMLDLILNCICVIQQFGNVDIHLIPKWFRCVSYLLQCECCQCLNNHCCCYLLHKRRLQAIAMKRQLKLQNVCTEPRAGDTPSTPNPGTCDNHTLNQYDDEDKVIELENTTKTRIIQVGIGTTTGMGTNLPTTKEGSTDIVLIPNSSPIIGSTVLRTKSSMTNISATTTSSILIEPKDLDSSSGYISHHSPYSPYSTYSPYPAGNEAVYSAADVNHIAVGEPKLHKLQTALNITDTYIDDIEQESHENQ